MRKIQPDAFRSWLALSKFYSPEDLEECKRAVKNADKSKAMDNQAHNMDEGSLNSYKSVF
ncbi:MAG: hypothetical protein ACFFE8_08355 [Candidatus Heimdallarchaeota archaeon]